MGAHRHAQGTGGTSGRAAPALPHPGGGPALRRAGRRGGPRGGRPHDVVEGRGPGRARPRQRPGRGRHGRGRPRRVARRPRGPRRRRPARRPHRRPRHPRGPGPGARAGARAHRRARGAFFGTSSPITRAVQAEIDDLNPTTVPDPGGPDGPRPDPGPRGPAGAPAASPVEGGPGEHARRLRRGTPKPRGTSTGSPRAPAAPWTGGRAWAGRGEGRAHGIRAVCDAGGHLVDLSVPDSACADGGRALAESVLERSWPRARTSPTRWPRPPGRSSVRTPRGRDDHRVVDVRPGASPPGRDGRCPDGRGLPGARRASGSPADRWSGAPASRHVGSVSSSRTRASAPTATGSRASRRRDDGGERPPAPAPRERPRGARLVGPEGGPPAVARQRPPLPACVARNGAQPLPSVLARCASLRTGMTSTRHTTANINRTSVTTTSIARTAHSRSPSSPSTPPP